MAEWSRRAPRRGQRGDRTAKRRRLTELHRSHAEGRSSSDQHARRRSLASGAIRRPDDCGFPHPDSLWPRGGPGDLSQPPGLGRTFCGSITLEPQNRARTVCSVRSAARDTEELGDR